jgi:ADP-ribosylglycohydrolase
MAIAIERIEYDPNNPNTDLKNLLEQQLQGKLALFAYNDNLQHNGMQGTAAIRDKEHTFGVPLGIHRKPTKDLVIEEAVYPEAIDNYRPFIVNPFLSLSVENLIDRINLKDWVVQSGQSSSIFFQDQSTINLPDPDPTHITELFSLCLSFFGMIMGDIAGGPLEFKHVRYDGKIPTAPTSEHKENPYYVRITDAGINYIDIMHKEQNLVSDEGADHDEYGVHFQIGNTGSAPDDVGNRFKLGPGQWTDDASMGICIADSVLHTARIDFVDIRKRFYLWWNYGYNNAFVNTDRKNKRSIGLGGNISKSLLEISANITTGEPVTPFYKLGMTGDAGNGGLMRNGVAVLCSTSAEECAFISGYTGMTTHPGTDAIVSTLLWGFLAYHATHPDPTDTSLDMKAFLEKYTAVFVSNKICENFLDHLEKSLTGEGASGGGASGGGASGDRGEAVDDDFKGKFRNSIYKITSLLGTEPFGDDSIYYFWNWRDENLHKIEQTRKNREIFRREGNPIWKHPDMPTYFGSYSMDGIVMALHSLYNTSSPYDALQYVVNLLGDSDSTGSMVGQIAFPFYGNKDTTTKTKDSLYKFCMAQLKHTDPNNTLLKRALILAGKIAERLIAKRAPTHTGYELDLKKDLFQNQVLEEGLIDLEDEKAIFDLDYHIQDAIGKRKTSSEINRLKGAVYQMKFKPYRGVNDYHWFWVIEARDTNGESERVKNYHFKRNGVLNEFDVYRDGTDSSVIGTLKCTREGLNVINYVMEYIDKTKKSYRGVLGGEM